MPEWRVNLSPKAEKLIPCNHLLFTEGNHLNAGTGAMQSPRAGDYTRPGEPAIRWRTFHVAAEEAESLSLKGRKGFKSHLKVINDGGMHLLVRGNTFLLD